MRPGNTRVPLVIAAVAAGLAYICLGRSTPADLLHWLPSLKIAMSGNHQSAKQRSDAADHRSDAHDEDKGDDEDADPDRTTSLTLPDFDGVILNTPLQATIVIGDRQSVVIERDNGTPDLTRASVSGGKLRITAVPTSRVTITLPHLRTLQVDGPGVVDMAGLRDPLTLVANGTAALTASGKVESIALTLNGPSNVSFAKLEARDVTLRLNGGGQADVFATGTLNADVHGEGLVRYLGQPRTRTKIIGHGSIEALGKRGQA